MICLNCGGYNRNPVRFDQQTFDRVQDQVQREQFEVRLLKKLGEEPSRLVGESVCPYLIYREPFLVNISDLDKEKLASRGINVDFSNVELQIYATVPVIEDLDTEGWEDYECINIFWVLYSADQPIGYGKAYSENDTVVWRIYAAYVAYQGLRIYPKVLGILRQELGPLRSGGSLSPGAVKVWERLGERVSEDEGDYYVLNPLVYSDEIKNRACQLRKEGLTYDQISDELGPNRNAIAGWCRERDISQKKPLSVLKAEVLELCNAGLSYREISRRTGASRESVSKWCGVPLSSIRRSKYSQELREKILYLRQNEGLNFSQIAREVEVPRTTIRDMFKLRE